MVLECHWFTKLKAYWVEVCRLCFETHAGHLLAVWPWHICIISLCVIFTHQFHQCRAWCSWKRVTHSFTVRITGFRMRRNETYKTWWESEKRGWLWRLTLGQKQKWRNSEGWMNKLLRIIEQAEKWKRTEHPLLTLCHFIFNHLCEVRVSFSFYLWRKRNSWGQVTYPRSHNW